MTASLTDRRLAVGTGTDQDGFLAGRRAAEAAEGDRGTLSLVFASPRFDPVRVLEGVREVTGGAPVIGCSSAGELTAAGSRGGSVVVASLIGSGLEAATADADAIERDPESAAARLAAALARVNGATSKALILLVDGLAPRKQELINALYARCGAAVPIVGGTATDDRGHRRTFQFHGTDVHVDGAVAAVISSEGPIGVGIEHGYVPHGDPVVVTASTGVRVLELDGRPALDVYLERNDAVELHAHGEAVLAAFARPRPLAISALHGRPHLRVVGRLDSRDGSLTCLAEVPQGSLAWFMGGGSESPRSAGREAVAEALAGLGAPPVGMLCFDCVARRGVLGGEGIEASVRTISTDAGDVPLAGFLGLGQIGRVRGLSGLHNQTLVVLGLG